MNTQESQALEDFLNQLVRAHGIVKDPLADRLIAEAASQQPDALYLLVQRALLMEHALNKAKSEIMSLQSQLQAAQAAPGRGFLDAEPWGNSAAASAYRPGPSAPAAPPQMQSAPMAPQAPAAAPGFFGGRLGGTLGTVAATAAGVAGGAFLFQGIEHLMHPGAGSGFMNQAGEAFTAPPVENTTVNNYYGSDRPSDSDSSVDDFADDTSWDDGSTSV